MFQRLCALGIALLLTACGGGGSGENFRAPAIRTSGELTANEAYVYVEIFGEQDARPESVTVNLRAGATSVPIDFKNAFICIRDYGSTRNCGSPGTITATIPNAGGGTFRFDVSTLSSVRSLGWGQRLILEVVVDYSPYSWRYGDFFSVAVDEIRYDFEGYSYPTSYIGYPGASVTLVRGGHKHIASSELSLGK